jgi:hypothetical protein
VSLNVHRVWLPEGSHIVLLWVTTATAHLSVSPDLSRQDLGNVPRRASPILWSLVVLPPRVSLLVEARSLPVRRKTLHSSLLSMDHRMLPQQPPPLLLVQLLIFQAGATRGATTANFTYSTRFSQDSHTLSPLIPQLFWTVTHASRLASSKTPPTYTQPPWAPLATARPPLHPPIHWRQTRRAAICPVRVPRRRGAVVR